MIIIYVLVLTSFARGMNKVELGNKIVEKTIVTIPSIGIDPNTGLSLDNENDTVTFGEERCKNCTDYIAEQIKSFQPIIAGLEDGKIQIQSVPPCQHCTMSNVGNIELYGDSCLNPVPNEPNKTDTKMNYKWPQLQLDCICELPTDQQKLFNTLSSIISKPPPTCGQDGTVIGTDSGTQGITDILFKPNLNKILSPNCISSVVGILSLPKSQNVSVTMIWQDTKLTGTVRKDKSLEGPDSVSVVAGHIIERNYSNIQATCNSESKAVNVCKCLIETEIFVVIMEQTLQLLINCLARSDDPVFKNVLNEFLVCNS